jgi:hypothetical protein
VLLPSPPQTLLALRRLSSSLAVPSSAPWSVHTVQCSYLCLHPVPQLGCHQPGQKVCIIHTNATCLLRGPHSTEVQLFMQTRSARPGDIKFTC